MNQIYYSWSNANGFRNIKSFDNNFGLLFKHSGAMVMDKVSIPLTAYFIDTNNTIVDIMNMKPEPYNIIPTVKYASTNTYDKVLEIKQSVRDKLNWNIGDTLIINANSIKKANNGLITTALSNSLTIKCKLGNEEWSGSGFLIAPEGYVITCAHVASLAFRPPFNKQTIITASFDGNTYYPVKVEAINYDIDAALLKIADFTNLGIDIPDVLPLGTTINTGIGEEIYIVSSPNSINNVVNAGIIASDIRHAPDIPAPVLFVDVNISPGSSGGMVISKRTNDIIGIARGSITNSGSEANGVNYCISIDELKKWLNKVTTKMNKFATKNFELGDIVKFSEKAVAEIYNTFDKFKDLDTGIVIDQINDNVLVKTNDGNILLNKNMLKYTGKSKTYKESNTPKIIIDKNNYSMQLYDKDNNKIHKFKISIGSQDSPTYRGVYKISEKEDYPFEPAFDQYLPHWVGFNEFYNLETKHGCIQGIHAVPLDKDEKCIGDPIGEMNSHGCIRLHIDDAAQIYKMCDIGDIVVIK